MWLATRAIDSFESGSVGIVGAFISFSDFEPEGFWSSLRDSLAIGATHTDWNGVSKYNVLSLMPDQVRSYDRSRSTGIGDKTGWTKPLSRLYRFAMGIVKRQECWERVGTDESWKP
jgi:hypothetical protein